MNTYKSSWIEAVREDAHLSESALRAAQVLSNSMTGLSATAYTTWSKLAKAMGRENNSRRAVAELRDAGYVGEYWCSTPGRSNGFKILTPSRPAAA